MTSAADIEPGWVRLVGAVNVRDLGGRPTVDGRAVRPRRLLRADNLQQLSPADVRLLVDDYGVRTVADLRTEREVELEGPGPMTRVAGVRIEHLSLVPEAGENTDVAGDGPSAQVRPTLAWHTDAARERRRALGGGTVGVYRAYLADRAPAVVAALRLIAHSDGAVLVHCAAGKDRTGVVVATALAEVGVTEDAVVADYVLSAERIDAIFARLASTPTYANDTAGGVPADHAPRPETMQAVLATLRAEHGGVSGWLRENGWTPGDAAALRAHLLG